MLSKGRVFGAQSEAGEVGAVARALQPVQMDWFRRGANPHPKTDRQNTFLPQKQKERHHVRSGLGPTSNHCTASFSKRVFAPASNAQCLPCLSGGSAWTAFKCELCSRRLAHPRNLQVLTGGSHEIKVYKGWVKPLAALTSPKQA